MAAARLAGREAAAEAAMASASRGLGAALATAVLVRLGAVRARARRAPEEALVVARMGMGCQETLTSKRWTVLQVLPQLEGLL